MKIDCTRCEMYRSSHCDDCLVTALLHPHGEEVQVDEEIGDSLQTLATAGLIPVLKFRPRRDPPADEQERADSA